MTRRASAGLAPFAVADLQRVAIIGFDLGAQTALAIAGESFAGALPDTARWNVRGVIALSPYVDLASGGMQTRFASIRMPVLTITGTDDLDPYGLISSESIRRAPWQSMVPGDKYELLLADGPHSVLAGSGLTARGSGTGAAGAGDPNRFESSDDNSRGRRWTGQSNGLDTDVLHQVPSGGRRSRNSNGNAATGERRSEIAGGRAFDPRHIAGIQSVSTAFLDAICKTDRIAREWLTRDAARFLGNSASLQSK